MRSRTVLLNLAAASAVLLAGCSAATSVEPASPPAVEHGVEHQAIAAGEGPSEPAKMICSEDIQDSIAAVFELSSVPRPVDSFEGGLYSCKYEVPGGTLELSVMELADEASAKDHAESMRGGFASTEDIEGLANLGLHAYRTPDGVVVFVKDNMTLTVDARQARLVNIETESPMQLAYQVATNVLACWKAHP